MKKNRLQRLADIISDELYKVEPTINEGAESYDESYDMEESVSDDSNIGKALGILDFLINRIGTYDEKFLLSKLKQVQDHVDMIGKDDSMDDSDVESMLESYMNTHGLSIEARTFIKMGFKKGMEASSKNSKLLK